MRRWLSALVLAACGAIPAGARAAPIATVLSGKTVGGIAIPCTTSGGVADGVRTCHGDATAGSSDLRLASFDGAPLEVYVILPPAPASGADGPYPLVVQSHGWGGSAAGATDTQYGGPTADAWAKRGYAVLQLTARGFGDSCGKSTPTSAEAPCAHGGYIHLDDERYEARDVQYAAGLLVDEGVAKPSAIGVTGESYGGGVSLELATLVDRVMNPDGSLSPWKSPAGTPLRISAAAPVIPWSDLAASLIPNGRTRDDELTSATDDTSPIGVEKESLTGGLFALGAATGTYNAADPQANLPAWFAAMSAGEPYESNPLAPTVLTQLTRYRSPYYLLDGAYGVASEEPAPMLIANGFTDDLFPVDEALRYANLERHLYANAPVGLFDGDFGHPRAQNKAGEASALSARIQSLFDYYLKDAATAPQLGATAYIETCPKSAPSGGPDTAPAWAALHPGEVDTTFAAAQTVASSAGSPTIAAALDPLAGGACASVSATDQGAGVATYRLPPATGAGYTLLGSATVTAQLTATGTYPFLAARLWDVDPATNTQTLVARGLYRLGTAPAGRAQSFQLHPGAWHFAPGHVPKLELLGQDAPYARTSNGTFSVTVSDLYLSLPVHEAPGTPGTPSGVVAFGSGHPPPPVPPCTMRPRSQIAHAGMTARRRLVVRGTASETTCPGIAPPRVLAVSVTIARHLGGGRCRFVGRTGALGSARPCRRAQRLWASGTATWRLALSGRLVPGGYVISAQAVDAHHVHEPATEAQLVFRAR